MREFGGFKIVLIGVGVSLCYDILWLSIFTKVLFLLLLSETHSYIYQGWSSGEVVGEEPQRKTFIFSLVMSYLLFLAKVHLNIKFLFRLIILLGKKQIPLAFLYMQLDNAVRSSRG